MAWFRRNRRTAAAGFVSPPAGESAEQPPTELISMQAAPDALRRRLRRSVEGEDARLMLEPAALAEGSATIDAVRANLDSWPGSAAASSIVDVSQLHRIRAIALDEVDEERHAQVTLSVLAYVLDAHGVAPAIREEATRAVGLGAETDLPMAILRAVQGHAYAVRAAALREEHNAVLADLFVHSFERILKVAGSNRANWSGRVLDLAVAHDHRSRTSATDGDPADLDAGIRLTEQVIEASAADPAAVLRAHKIRAPMLMARDDLAPGRELEAAEQSFRAIVELAPPGDPILGDTRQRLAAVQRLIQRRPPRG